MWLKKILVDWYKKHIIKANTPKIRLWVDDERDPRDPVIQKNFGAVGDEVWVKTEQEAIEYLSQGNVEFISLDCDLGENAGRGYKVAEWIEEKAFNHQLAPMEWEVHSQNSVEALKSIQALLKADLYWDALDH